MNENFTMKVADQIPFVAVAPDEICRINADGTTTYHWDRIEAAAQRWEPGCADIVVCLAKLLLPLRRQHALNAELLEALRVAVDSDLGRLWVWPESAKETWLTNARAAIAKAEGEKA
jgi:hypothetical protein